MIQEGGRKAKSGAKVQTWIEGAGESFSLRGYQLSELDEYMSFELTKLTGGAHSSEHVWEEEREEKHAVYEHRFLWKCQVISRESINSQAWQLIQLGSPNFINGD